MVTAPDIKDDDDDNDGIGMTTRRRTVPIRKNDER